MAFFANFADQIMDIEYKEIAPLNYINSTSPIIPEDGSDTNATGNTDEIMANSTDDGASYNDESEY